jgi:hypothetical protein
MADIGTLTPEQMLQQQQILRQQKMAEILMNQPAPQGQMISGRYVAPSFTQNLASLANLYVGQRAIEKGDQAQLDLARQLRADETSAMADFMQQRQGRPAVPDQVTEMAGPYAGSVPMPTATIAGTPAVAPNPQGAYASLLANPKASSRLQNMAFNKMIADPESFTLSADQTRFVTMPDGTTKQVAAGTKKPIQIDTGTAIEFRDPDDMSKVLQRIPKSQMPNAGQVVEREDGTYLIDTRTGQARPVMGAGGQPLIGGGKPLTETQSNAVAFGARAKESNKIVTDLEKAGVTNTGIIRSALGGTVGTAPIVGEKLEQGVRSAFNVLPTALGGPSPEQQQVDQARRNFISAVLRKESGAAISPTEFVNEERKYFPQIGDSDAVIKQKQDARLLAIKALEAQAGPSGVRQINQITNQSTGNVIDFNSLPKGR